MQAIREAADPREIDLQVLDLASQKGVGGSWTAISSIKNILRDRGYSDEDVIRAIQILEKRKAVELRVWSCTFEERYGYADTQLNITTEGEDRLRNLRVSVALNVRLPGPLARELGDYARQFSQSSSAAVVQLLQEGLRTARFPGIDFRWTPTGRVPHVTGTGLTIWELHRIWKDRAEDTKRIEDDYPHLTGAQISAGVAYAKAYIHEMPVRPPAPPFVVEVKV